MVSELLVLNYFDRYRVDMNQHMALMHTFVANKARKQKSLTFHRHSSVG